MRLLAGTALLLAFALPATAQTIRSDVDARKLGVQDQLTLTLTVEGDSLPDTPPSPVLTNLRVVGGPSVSTQMSWVNGRSTQSRSWTYLLQPKAVGHAEVGAIKVGDATAPAISIEVVAGSVPRIPIKEETDMRITRLAFGDRCQMRAQPLRGVEADDGRSLVVGRPESLSRKRRLKSIDLRRHPRVVPRPELAPEDGQESVRAEA